MNRRDAVSILSLFAFAAPDLASAKSRPAYGGRLRLTLPLDLASIDPHDSASLTSALLGPSLFEPLYGLTSAGRPYPTLATDLPEPISGGVRLRLRPGLTFSDGNGLDAKRAAISLVRSRSRHPPMRDWGAIRSHGRDTLTIASTDPKTAARVLSHLGTAIVPEKFSPARPLGCGALLVRTSGRSLVLERNPRAPRGGSYIEQVSIQSGDLRTCLRNFEARISDLGFLGAGLHQPRKDVRAFRLSGVGLALLRPGRNLSSFARPGALNAALGRLPSDGLSSLGVSRPSEGVARWPGPALEILVSSEQSWLEGIARQLQSAWNGSQRPVTVRALPTSDLNARMTSGNYDAALTFLSTSDLLPRQISEELFRLDGKLPPRAGRTLTPFEAARQLNLGVIGELVPRGFADRKWEALFGRHCLRLDEVRKVRP